MATGVFDEIEGPGPRAIRRRGEIPCQATARGLVPLATTTHGPFGLVVCTIALISGCASPLHTRAEMAASSVASTAKVSPGAGGAAPASDPHPTGPRRAGAPVEDAPEFDEPRMLGYGLLGLAAVSAGISVGFAFSADRLAAETQGLTRREHGRYAELSREVDEARSAMLVGFAASAVFTSVGAWLLLSDGPAATGHSWTPTATGWSVRW